MDKQTEELTFEEALHELEGSVSKLEEGNLSLEDSLKIYERGRALSGFCQQYLENAELRIEHLTEDGEIVDTEID
ncbi:MAG: exodeoxyribonuclease VII small subunit [Cellvibrionaceae bacterium]|jgi:exodeoxyribonuclease VII small subunit